MNERLRIAMFVGCFPVVSETFILRQIKGLIELGHEVDIYADTRGDSNTPQHSEIAACRMMERTTLMGSSTMSRAVFTFAALPRSRPKTFTH